MTLTTRHPAATLPIGDAVASLLRDGMPVRFTAYDGSAAGPPDAEIGLELSNQRGLSYLLTAPGDLGMARAYVSGDLQVHGVHPGDPYEALKLLQNHLRFRKPARRPRRSRCCAGWACRNLKPPPPPPQEHLPRWRRVMEGVRHSMSRDAEVIHHHYDVSNRFYELVLGPSMTYTCAVYPSADATLEEAQTEKYDLVARKLDLKPGQRLLDVGCGWGGMVRHAAREYGVQALGVTLSREQAAWAQEAIKARGARPPRRGAPPRLPRRRGGRLRRGQLDRPDRAHRGAQLPGVLRASCATSCARRAGCSTTASPARTTAAQTPARSSTATSSPTAS